MPDNNDTLFNSVENSSGAEQTEMEQIYVKYVVYAQAEGITPLSYEAWLATVKGEKGEQGPQGEKGDKGDQGSDGVSITTTFLNNKGELIIILSTGESINLGKITGEDGQDGKDGVNGEDGQNGTDGKDGIDGVDGKSAYELYCEAYPEYKGTLTEWLASLKGEKGDQGEQGVGIESVL